MASEKKRSRPTASRPKKSAPAAPVIPELGKANVVLRLSRRWIAAADELAVLYSLPTKIWRRSAILREALAIGLAKLSADRERPWPPQKPRRLRKLRPDYAALATKKILGLLRTEKEVARTQITRLLKSRDRSAMDDALTFLIQQRYVELSQVRTAGRTRAVYTWLGGVDGNITDGEIDLIVQELATQRALGNKRRVAWRVAELENDRKRRLKEWDDAQERIAAKANESGFRPPVYAPPSAEARATFDAMHADYEKGVRAPKA